MIVTMPRMSTAFLPTIKCSDCNVEIEISAMGDHICISAPSLPTSKSKPFNAPVKNSIPLATTSTMRSLKAPPVGIDPVSANRPPAPQTKYGSNRSNVGLRSISPTTSETSQRSGRTMSPALFRPPSLDVSVSQDSAFPPFPTSKSRSATPTTPSDPASTFSPDDRNSERQPRSSISHSPVNSKQISSSVLQRMNSIAPGPFNINKPANQSVPGHQRTATTASKNDFVRSSYSSNGSTHSRQVSISATTHPRNPSLSSISGGPRSTLHRVVADSPTLPVMPPLFKDSSISPERIQHAKSTPPTESLNQVGRSHTYPLEGGQEPKAQREKPPATRRPSEAAAVMKPLHEIGSTSTFKSSRSMKGRNAAPTIESPGTGIFDPNFDLKQGPANNELVEKTAQIQKPINAPTRGYTNPYHTPTESNSSNESSGSDSRSVSSRSTPPSSASPQRSKRRPSQAGQTDSLIQDFRFGTEQVPVINEPVPRRVPPPSFSRPIYARTADPPPSLKEVATFLPDSPTDPAIQSGRPSPAKVPSHYNAPTIPLQNGNLRLSPAPPPPPALPISPIRKPTTVNKGKCRGCGELIKGKSVSSADGRLTGRYHRNCFVCKTCREPFQTADFYVLDNHPFCARHYHQLNGSLCKHCDKGIEGQYLETESKQKFHPYCFTCQDCHKILRDDYFEMNGKTFCEQHALRAAQQTSLLGPGRRHPERRTTRLMMM